MKNAWYNFNQLNRGNTKYNNLDLFSMYTKYFVFIFDQLLIYKQARMIVYVQTISVDIVYIWKF